VVTVALNAGVRVLRVIGMAPKRGDASAAAQLYEEIGNDAVRSMDQGRESAGTSVDG
jgi:hypothetical protein